MSNPFGGNAKGKTKADPFAPGGGDPFSTTIVGGGGTGTGVKIAELMGELLLIRPTEYIEAMVTSANPEPTDAVRADIVVLREDGTADEHDDFLVFPVLLKPTLKAALDKGELFLGRLGTGDKKPGKSAPYVFTQASADDAKLASAYGTAHDWW
jgi:hypothetical protein